MFALDSLRKEKFSKETRTFSPPLFLRKNAFVQDYDALYSESISDPNRFWGKIAEEFLWDTKWETVSTFNPPHHEWFLGGKTNITMNALDRNIVSHRRNKVALLWSSENGRENIITYDRLLRRVCQVANGLKANGIEKGDRVVIFLPNIPEAVYAMLACARIGAIHVVCHTSLGVQALKSRIEDTEAKAIFCTDATYNNGKMIPVKAIVDDALRGSESVEKIIVLRRIEPKLDLSSEREIDFYDFIDGQPQWINPEIVDSNHPLFILYTSGTSGKPKGVVHVHGGYMVGTYYAAKSFYEVKEYDIFWNTSNLGWIAGHSFIVYGLFLNGASVMLREGSIDFPDASTFYRLIERHGVNVVATTPNVLQRLMKAGTGAMKKYDISTLRLLASSSGYLEPDVHEWVQKNIMSKRGCVVESWAQTEIAAPALGDFLAYDTKLSKVGKPMPGVELDVVSLDGKSVAPNQSGLLVLRKPLPHLMHSIWNAEDRYKKYWKHIPNCFNTGDVAFKDEDGYFCVMGRIDDVLKVGGTRLSFAEIEKVLGSHRSVAEAAVVGIPDPKEGEVIKAFVVVKPEFKQSETLKSILRDHLRHELGLNAVPSIIEFRNALPKDERGEIAHEELKK